MAGVGTISGVWLEELLQLGFGVVLVLFNALVGTGAVVAQRQELLAQMLVKMPKVTGSDDGVEKKQDAFVAVFVQGLHLQAASTGGTAFVQVVGLEIRTKPI